MDHGTHHDPDDSGGRVHADPVPAPSFDEFEALRMRTRIFNLLWWFCYGGDGR